MNINEKFPLYSDSELDKIKETEKKEYFKDNLNLIIIGKEEYDYAKNFELMSRYTAEMMAGIIKELNNNPEKEKIVLGLAADTSPLGVYEEFSKITKRENLDLSKIIVVRYEQSYGPLIKEDSPFNFDNFHKEKFFEANGIKSVPAEIVKDKYGKEIIKGNFFPMFKQYDENNKDEVKKDIKRVADNYENILSKLGGIDLALTGVGKDGHILNWGPNEKMLKIRETREKTPEEYDNEYERFSKGKDYRNSQWEDMLSASAKSLGISDEKAKKGVVTTATLGIRHIVGATKLVIIAPQPTKAETAKEIFYGENRRKDNKMINPASSVVKIRNVLGKKTLLVLTPEAAKEIKV